MKTESVIDTVKNRSEIFTKDDRKALLSKEENERYKGFYSINYKTLSEFQWEFEAQFNIKPIFNKIDSAIVDRLVAIAGRGKEDPFSDEQWIEIKRYMDSDGWGGRTIHVLLFNIRTQVTVKAHLISDNALFFSKAGCGSTTFVDINGLDDDAKDLKPSRIDYF